MLEEVLESLAGDGEERKEELGDADVHGEAAKLRDMGRVCAREATSSPFYWRRPQCVEATQRDGGVWDGQQQGSTRAAQVGSGVRAYRGATHGGTDSHGARRACLSREVRPQAVQHAWGRGPAVRRVRRGTGAPDALLVVTSRHGANYFNWPCCIAKHSKILNRSVQSGE
jgi:hypothetical protein